MTKFQWLVNCAIAGAMLASAGSACAREEGQARGPEPLNPEDWARKIQENYPPAALRSDHEGTVVMTIAIGASGRVTQCDIKETSGFESLDKAGCEGMQQFARYRPATDENGQPVAATTQQAVRYVLPGSGMRHRHPSPINYEDWYAAVFTDAIDEALRDADVYEIRFQLVIDEQGRADGCGVLMSSGDAILDRQICAALQREARFEPATLLDGTPIPGAFWVGGSPIPE